MNKTASDDESGMTRKRGRIKGKAIPVLTLLFVVVISVGIFYFYQQDPSRFEELKTYGYLGAFLISLIFNATVILPVGSVLVISALGAVLPSATIVGLAGGTGAAIGEITGYMAGYSGRGIAEKSRVYRQVEGWVRRWGAPTIFIFSLLPFVFDLVGLVAGAVGAGLVAGIVAALAGTVVAAVGGEAVGPGLAKAAAGRGCRGETGRAEAAG